MSRSLVLLVLGASVAAAGFTWNVTDPNNLTCVLMQFDKLHFSVLFENQTTPYTFDLVDSSVTHVSGKCHDSVNGTPANKIEIDFQPTVSSRDGPWTLTIWFTTESKPLSPRVRRGVASEIVVPKREKVLLGEENAQSFRVLDFELSTAVVPGVNASDAEIFDKSEGATLEWAAADTKAFTCSVSGLSFERGTTADFSGLSVIAGAMLDKAEFPANQQYSVCDLDSKTSDTVPIIVGCLLALLVLVVLGAYLVGRHRARRTGYASV